MPNTVPDGAVHVVAGIIWDERGKKILISRRPDHLHKGGCWEFPGGKVESGETLPEALARELEEELGISFGANRFFRRIIHSYPEKRVCLDFFEVFAVAGEVTPRDGQAWRWVSLAEMAGYVFPEANVPIISELISSYSADPAI
jgi:8-oxo-dGTP diphosphatase